MAICRPSSVQHVRLATLALPLATRRRLRVVTRCASREDFIATFAADADAESLFIVTQSPPGVGTRRPFAIQLQGGETVLRGEAEVVESHVDATGPRGQRGMRLRILALDEASRAMQQELLAQLETEPSPPSIPPHSAPRSLAAMPKPPAATATPLAGLVASEAAAPARRSTESPSRDVAVVAPTLAPPTEVDQRAPGSSYILPANPFHELPNEALEHFVDCTLYEETTVDGIGLKLPPVAMPDFHAAPISLWPLSLSAPQVHPAMGSSRPAPASAAGRESAGVAAAAGQPEAAHPRPLETPVATFAEGAGVEIGRAESSATQAGLVHRRGFLLAATAVASTALSLMLGYVIWGKGTALSAAPLVVERRQQAGAEAQPREPAAPVTVAPVSAPPRPPCVVNVRSEPLGATVLWNGDRLGTTPLANARIPCGTAQVVFSHPKFVTSEQTVVAKLGTAARAVAKLRSPRAKLELTSSPPGALFHLNGKRLGAAPVTVDVAAFVGLDVVATMPGYGAWWKQITIQPEGGVEHATLSPRVAQKRR